MSFIRKSNTEFYIGIDYQQSNGKISGKLHSLRPFTYILYTNFFKISCAILLLISLTQIAMLAMPYTDINNTINTGLTYLIIGHTILFSLFVISLNTKPAVQIDQEVMTIDKKSSVCLYFFGMLFPVPYFNIFLWLNRAEQSGSWQSLQPAVWFIVVAMAVFSLMAASRLRSICKMA